jgi:hypothetical protein
VRWFGALLLVLAALGHRAALAGGFTETLPRNTFLFDIGYSHSLLKNAYDNDGNKTQLIDPLYRYEPGGGLQGIVLPDASVTFDLMILQLRYGLLDNLTVAIGIPVVLRTRVEPRLGWVSGDYQWPMGRSYSEQDFWDWAASMGQPKPGTWSGNQGALSDIVLGFRYRFSDHFATLTRHGIGMALTAYGALPTGSPKDPEEIVAVGTTSWELHFQGEIGVHLAVDKSFFAGRLTVGLELFYEALLKHRYQTPRGTRHPLVLNLAPYVGETYTLDPGDFFGFSVQIDLVALQGPARESWITKGDAARAASLPAVLTFSLRYTHTHLGQSDWDSSSALWDWTQEKLWRPGYKNILAATLVGSFLRLGVPLQVYATYQTMSLLPGKNSRATDVLSVGLRAPWTF